MKNVNLTRLFSLIILSVGALFIGSCDKDGVPKIACDLTFPFENVEWIATDTQPSECKWMLFKYKYKDAYYYSIGNHCVDMVAFVASCDGINICNKDENLCNRVLSNGTNLGIVAMEKE